jgi:TRAP-type C4-dicarboxylate transport system permease small subunit
VAVRKWLGQAVHLYTNLLESLIFILFAALVIVGLLAVLSRNVPGFIIISWGEEVMLFLQVAVVFLVSGLALRRGLHVGFDLLVGKLPPVLQRFMITLNYLLVIWFLVTLIRAGIPVVKSNMEQLSTNLQIPMGYPFMALVIGAVLMIGECLGRIFQVWSPDVAMQSLPPGIDRPEEG